MDETTEILAKTLYGEARGETLSGMEAVASVIMNRVRHAQRIGKYWWGSTIREVCLKPYQFSCWNIGDANCDLLRRDLSGDILFGICRRIAERAVKGLLPDNTNGATHYHTHAVHPVWAHKLVPCADIGNHVFYACY